MVDMITKGRKRSALGSDVGNSKLNEAQVLRIFSDERPYNEITEEFSISYDQVLSIKSKRNWKHLTKDLERVVKRKILSVDLVLKVFRDVRSNDVIAKDFGICRSTVFNIKNKRCHVKITKGM